MKPIPTLSELNTTIGNDLKSRLNISGILKRVLTALTAVLAGQFKLAYYFLFDIQNNTFPDTAETESNGGTLERFGRLKIGRNPLPATVGVFVFNVTGVAGSILRSGLTFKANEGTQSPGQLYVLDAEYVLTGSGDTIEVRSLGAGASFALNVSDNLTITEPVIGVDKTVSVASITTPPTETETIEDYREKVLESYQLEPQGGAAADYRIWASDAQGVRKIYPYVNNGNAGVVDVYVESTIADSTDGYGTPTTGILQDVEDVIEFDPDETKELWERGRRPIQAVVNVQPITLAPVTITIQGLTDSTTPVRNAIKNSVLAYLYDVRPYIAGADLTRNRNDVLYAPKLQGVVSDAISSSNFFTGFTVSVFGTEQTAYQFELGTIPYLSGDIIYS